jgi:ParB-like chromosome segregation protein Spo0J
VTEIHEYAAKIPDMAEDEFNALRDDIRANGLIEPIVMCDGKILDGRHRYRACEDIGIEPRTVEYAGSDPFQFVTSVNVMRRHLTPSQRAMIGNSFATRTRQDHSIRTSADRPIPPTQEDVAKAFGVSERSIQNAAALRRDSPTPSLVKAVESGHIELRPALDLIKRTTQLGEAAPAVIDDVVERIVQGAAEDIPEAAAQVVADASRNRRLDALRIAEGLPRPIRENALPQRNADIDEAVRVFFVVVRGCEEMTALALQPSEWIERRPRSIAASALPSIRPAAEWLAEVVKQLERQETK